jgi:hypothetical protein
MTHCWHQRTFALPEIDAIQLLTNTARLLSKLQQRQRHRPFGGMAQGLKPSSSLMSQVVPLVLQI